MPKTILLRDPRLRRDKSTSDYICAGAVVCGRTRLHAKTDATD